MTLPTRHCRASAQGQGVSRQDSHRCYLSEHTRSSGPCGLVIPSFPASFTALSKAFDNWQSDSRQASHHREQNKPAAAALQKKWTRARRTHDSLHIFPFTMLPSSTTTSREDVNGVTAAAKALQPVRSHLTNQHISCCDVEGLVTLVRRQNR